MADDDVAPRPRRERPLRAPGRDQPIEPEETPPPPTVTTPPAGPPVIQFTNVVEERPRDDHVVLSFDGPTKQRRWTIAIRLILALPHFLWLVLVSVAGFVVVVLSWFAALFIGRVPEGMAGFLSSVLQYQTRVYGYGWFLLSDKYPPFALTDDYAINVRTAPGRLNRASVLFRVILMVPGAFVATIALSGAQVVGLFGWLLALLMGRLPTPLWEANAAALSYYTRFYAFTGMLTAEQPKGLFGDRDQGAVLPPPLPGAEPDLPAHPQISRLVLSKAARRIVVLFIVLGLVTQVVNTAITEHNAQRANESLNKLDDSDSRLTSAIDRFNAETQRCAFSGGLTCLHAADVALADAFTRFDNEVQQIAFPPNVDAGPLIGDARDCADALRRMSAANDQSSYGTAYHGYTVALQHYDDDYNTVFGY